MAHDHNGKLMLTGEIVNVPVRILAFGDQDHCQVVTIFSAPECNPTAIHLHSSQLEVPDDRKLTIDAETGSELPLPSPKFLPPFLLQFFEYKHLRPELQAISKPFHDLAWKLAVNLPTNPETSAALRKLLEAKDCAVRAAISKPL